MMVSRPKIYFDSCCFIDIVANDARVITKEKRDYHVQCYKGLLSESQKNNITIFTSYLTIVECTHVKDESQKKVLTEEVKRLFNSVILSGMAGITPIMPTSKIIEKARQLNWDYDISLKPFDLLHIASALETDCCEFVTTDANSIDKDNNLLKIENFGLKVIQVTDSNYLPPDHIQTKIKFNE